MAHNTRNIQRLNQIELEKGLIGKASWHDQFKDSAYIYVGSLPFELTEGDLIAIFSQYGEVIDLDLIRDIETGKSKGFCFIGYENQKSTVLAVDNLNGIKILDRTIRVDHTEKYVKRPMKGESEQEFQEREQRRRDLVLPPHLKPGYVPESDDEEEGGAAKLNEDPMSSYFSEKKMKKEKKEKKEKKGRKRQRESSAERNHPRDDSQSSRKDHLSHHREKYRRDDSRDRIYDKYDRSDSRERSGRRYESNYSRDRTERSYDTRDRSRERHKSSKYPDSYKE
ncbi:RNA-binding motif protein, X-linked 2 [Boothiomyces macroporosus]|uniref:RNA-binding motif protein, X-linked 2 n=1 Tax=Boothiomyces macroporosus TaxID=261099 RepID=A0AAD5Y4U8_9FUNG|nr:RNA-binding motif protein, X-linked 2 [Boothiomyces macroporosus]